MSTNADSDVDKGASVDADEGAAMRPDPPLGPDPEGIPTTLRDREAWVCWHVGCRNCHTTVEYGVETCPECGNDTSKIPDDATSGRYASSTDPETWTDFEAALAYYERDDTHTAGVGYVFTEDGPFVGVDLDNCRDPDTGDLDPWAADAIERCSSYAAVSSSGTGIHILAVGELPEGGNRSGNVEMYEAARYFALTGSHIDGTPEEPQSAQDAIDALHAEHIADDPAGDDDQAVLDDVDGIERHDTDTGDGVGTSASVGIGVGFPGSDDELVAAATRAENGETFERLWSGDTTGYDSHSEARQALANLLAFWTGGDEQRMLDLFHQSDLYRDDDDLRTFENYEIPTALEDRDAEDFYNPDHNGDGQDGLDAPRDVGSPGAEWEYVRDLFNRSDKGTTTLAYNAAVDAALETETYTRIREKDAWYWFDPDDGYHKRPGDEHLREQLAEALPGHMNSNRESNIIGRMRPRINVSKDEFTPPERKVVVGNGVLDLDTREVEPHTPDYYFTSALACDYDPDARANEWLDVLAEWVPDDDARATLQEFAGYCLESAHHKREKTLFCVGPTQSGKSTFADTIAALFGNSDPSVTGLSPQEISHGRFARAGLIDAAVNIRNDINNTPIEDSGTLKTILSGEAVKMERKHKPATRDRSTAKHIFTANWLPPLVGQDEAFFRRVLLVEFPHTVPRAERDNDLKERLADPETLSGVLNWALDGYDRLHEQGGFTRDRPLMETRMKWLGWRAAPLRFLFDRCTITGNSDDDVGKKEAYQAYKEWATREGADIHPQESMTQLWKQVPFVEATTRSADDTIGGGRRGVFAGVRLDGDAATGWTPPR
ncbi:phage/plasmid primase, P4 family [Haloarcula sp. H-GB5]